MYHFLLLVSVIFVFETINDLISEATAFSIPKSSWNKASTRTTHHHFAASASASDADTTTRNKKQLTDRQLQFWEDVDEGLDDIESFWGKKSENIDRIRLFALRYEKNKSEIMLNAFLLHRRLYLLISRGFILKQCSWRDSTSNRIFSWP